MKHRRLEGKTNLSTVPRVFALFFSISHLREYVPSYGLAILCAMPNESRIRIDSESSDLDKTHENSYCGR